MIPERLLMKPLLSLDDCDLVETIGEVSLIALSSAKSQTSLLALKGFLEVSLVAVNNAQLVQVGLHEVRFVDSLGLGCTLDVTLFRFKAIAHLLIRDAHIKKVASKPSFVAEVFVYRRTPFILVRAS